MRWNVKLRKSGATPKYQQLADFIRDACNAGRLKPGEKVPSVADLARSLGVSKPTIVQAFRELEKEGLLVAQVGRGSFIAEPPRPTPAPSRAPSASSRPGAASSVTRAAHPSFIRKLMAMPVTPGTIDLRSPIPPVLSTTEELFADARARLAKTPVGDLFDYTVLGVPRLREAIADRLRDRGLDIPPDQVLITNGAQGALSLIALWARAAERRVFWESPICLRVPAAMERQGRKVAFVEWGRDSIDLAPVRAAEDERVMLCCTPDFNNPTGRCLSLEARSAIAELTVQRDAIVVVDEISRDLRFRGEHPPSLFDILPEGSGVLVGSFSKAFMPGLRAGFTVADAPTIDALVALKADLDLGCPAAPQHLMAAVLEGDYDGHLEAMRTHLRERCDALSEGLAESLPEDAGFDAPDGGSHIWLELPARCSSIDLYFTLADDGVAVRPGPSLDIDARYDHAVRLSYGAVTTEEARAGGLKVGAAVGRLLDAPGESARSRSATLTLY